MQKLNSKAFGIASGTAMSALFIFSIIINIIVSARTFGTPNVLTGEVLLGVFIFLVIIFLVFGATGFLFAVIYNKLVD